MKILLAGGGSGGHVTPLKAIYEALKQQEPVMPEVAVIVDRGFYTQTLSIFGSDSNIEIKKISSGKYRRYKSKSLVWHIVHLPTLLKNLRDIFLLGIGVTQSVFYFLLHKPDVVFCKGGFVCVPVGLAARLFKVPLIIHDSDTRPGLTNRILARWAKKIGTGMPTSFYPYPKSAMVYTGIPVKSEFKKVSSGKKQAYKRELDLPVDRPIILVTGGGNGSTPLNNCVQAAAQQLLEDGWGIVHLAGKGKAAKLLEARDNLPKDLRSAWRIDEFADMVPRLLAADVVISRTSASTIQECANAQKTVIGIPSPHLDDQKLNAEFFDSKKAIIYLDEENLLTDRGSLSKVLKDLKADPKRAEKLALTLHEQFSKPLAAQQLARLISDTALSS